MCRLMVVDQKQIGDQLRQHRTKKPRISLYRLADETKVLTAAGISNYETGYRRLKVREAKILSEAFKRLGRPISAAKILDIEETQETKQSSAVREDYMKTAKNIPLIRMVKKIVEDLVADKTIKVASDKREKLEELAALFTLWLGQEEKSEQPPSREVKQKTGKR